MPNFRKLSPAEVQTIEYQSTGQFKLVKALYDDLLQPFTPGDYGLVELAPDEQRATVRSRLRAAARRRGFSLRFIRAVGNTLRFCVDHGVSDDEYATSDEVAAYD